MTDKINQNLTSSFNASFTGFTFEECAFPQAIQSNSITHHSSQSIFQSSGINFANSIPSLQNSLKINTFSIIDYQYDNNEPNFFMNYDQEPASPRNDNMFTIKKETSFCEINEQQINNGQQQGLDFFNEKSIYSNNYQNNNNNNNNIFNFQNSIPHNNQNNNNNNNSLSKNQMNVNQLSNSKNNNQNNQTNNYNQQCEKNNMGLFSNGIDYSPTINCFTQGININVYSQEAQKQQQQYLLSQNANTTTTLQNNYTEFQLIKADSIADEIQYELPQGFLKDISFEMNTQSQFMNSNKSQPFENSYGFSLYQQQNQPQCMIHSLMQQQQTQQYFNQQQDQFQQSIPEEDISVIVAKKEEEDTTTNNSSNNNNDLNKFGQTSKSEQMFSLAILNCQDFYESENYISKTNENLSMREASTRSQTFMNCNQQLAIPSSSNIESSCVSPRFNSEYSSSQYTPNKTKTISKRKDKSKQNMSALQLPILTEKVVEQKNDRKRSKKTLFYKGSDGKSKKFARITKSMIRPVCNAVYKHLKIHGAVVEKIDWLNQLRSFLIENQKFIPTAIDFFQNHFENYVNNSPKLIEKNEYLLFKENWIRGVSDPMNFKGLKQIN